VDRDLLVDVLTWIQFSLLEQAWQNNLKNDLEVFYSRFHIALLNATSNNEFLVANLEWIVRYIRINDDDSSLAPIFGLVY
jgi:hypothetical protein